ncbi:MAG: hypothetical protein OSB21_06760 [Myxococcota bacterium]|nr:hypothetical protein [Myxococcota bacterium]
MALRICTSLLIVLFFSACSKTADVPAVSGCSSDDDCARPLSCLLGQCRQAICEPGLLRCNESDLEACTPDGQGFAFNRACGAGCDEENTRCRDAICAAFATRCFETNKERCIPGGGGWVLEEECDQGCVEGTCVTPGDRICTDGQTRCIGGNVETCNTVGSGWMHNESCAHGCAAGVCSDAPCPEGQMRCNNATLEICGGAGWRYGRTCDFGCREGGCLESVCERGAVQCRADDVEACAPDQRSWLYRHTCEGSCEEGACVGGGSGCREGQRRCNGDMLETCNNSATWETERQCDEGCRSGSCTICRPGVRRCDGLQPQLCSDNGAGYANQGDVCQTSCVVGRCGVCDPGERRCSGANIELCGEAGQAWGQLSACLTHCDNGACTVCTPGAVRCFGRTVQTCAQDGSAWADNQQCNGACRDGACQGEVVCPPGTMRCSAQNLQTCTPQGAGWLTVESCMGRCENAACVGPSCLPLELTASPAQLPADESSSTLISSALILSHNGTAVPDGSLFTVSTTGGTLLAQDGDPNTPGVQVRSLNGRIDFAVQAPGMEENNQVPQPITARAEHPLAGRCAGTAQITFIAPVNDHFTALDFTSATHNDTEVTNALWDTALGRVDPFPSDFGAGEDGDLTIGGTYNINTNSQPGRLFPDAVNFVVTEVGAAQVVVRGGVGGLEIGDEVLLINLQGDATNHGNVGNYEIKEVARINYGQNTVFFTTSLTKIYGATDANADITVQKIMLQRVPRYRSLRVIGSLTADSWDGEKNGIMFVKVLGSAEVLGNINMDSKGYRPGETNRPGESISGFIEPTFDANQGGGGGFGGTDRTTDDYSYGTPRNYGCNCNVYWAGQNINEPNGGGGAGYGTAGETVESGQGGNTYGEADLRQWFLGSAGATTTATGHARRRQYRYCCGLQWQGASDGPAPQPTTGSRGGGTIVLWASGISIGGTVRANQQASGNSRGSGGTVFLRARSMNVGSNKVQATGGTRGGHGRIRLDFFGLSGTTTPAFHSGFAGDTIVQTSDLSGVGNPVAAVTFRQSLEDRRGGTIGYRVSNGATNDDQELIWHPIAAGETVNFPENQPGTALRMRATFSNDNLQPLALIGLSLGWSRTP